MEALLFNNSHQALVLYTSVSLDSTESNISDDVEIYLTKSLTNSPIIAITATILVSIFSPTIIIGNLLLLIAMHRFKRLQTPSNYLVMSLASSDLGIGVFMPIGMYLELCGARQFTSANVCLFSYGIPITLCCVSVLVMVAIAVDRFTSLARPLRYNNLITHTAVERYIAVFWVFSALVGFTPFGYHLFHQDDTQIINGYCSFGSLVAKPVQLFMFCAVYGPSAFIVVTCYGYIYVVARGHARAISEVRHSLHYHHGNTPPRYGVALAITTGMFIILWLPFQICMLMDVFAGTNILSGWISIYLALPLLANSAINPWVYGYRNGELRAAVRKVVDDLLTVLGFTYRSHQVSDPIAPSVAATAGDPAASFIHHVQQDCFSFKHDCGEFVLVPIAKPESSGILSDSDNCKVFRDNPKLIITSDKPRQLKGSRSMIETFAISNGTDVWIIRGKSIGVMNGASIV